jgi:HKD family nuclease
MNVDFIAQPHATFRLGDFLKNSLLSKEWTEFYAAVAFVKRSGTKHIADALQAFSKEGKVVRISAGIDADGTSEEGLKQLLQSVEDRGSIFIHKNANNSTFHPKIYLFKNDAAAALIVGSGNLTEGGLFTNYEASLLMRLDLNNTEHTALLADVLKTLASWSAPTEGLCYQLSDEFLKELVAKGEVPGEAKAWGEEKRTTSVGTSDAPLFKRYPVPAAPKVPTSASSGPSEAEVAESEAEQNEDALIVEVPPPVAAQGGKHKIFLITLQKTDVGVGQTTVGTQRRSPELFIPVVCVRADPEFWGWPDLYVPDPDYRGKLDKDGRGKMDRPNVTFRLGGQNFPVHMWYNSNKIDLRLRSETLRSAGSLGDLLYIERADGAGGFSYYVDFIPPGSAKFAEYAPRCVTPVRNSPKLWGYI